VTPRQSNNPKRRLASRKLIVDADLNSLAARIHYSGSAHHKRTPGDYGFQPPSNPRPGKSLCDGKRSLLRAEAEFLLRKGVLKGFVSPFLGDNLPKYVWSIDDRGDVYEAKFDTVGYHGYLLEESDDFQAFIVKEWARQCQA